MVQEDPEVVAKEEVVTALAVRLQPVSASNDVT